MNKLDKMIVARDNGIVRPYQAMRVSEEVGIPYAVMCAFLEQESYGGRNVYGSDPTIFVGAGRVTKKNYAQYKKAREASGNKLMQGVGPMQLTWWEFQDEADERGGCWNPYINMLVGAEIIADDWLDTKDWKVVGTRYNGSSAYGDEIVEKIAKWRARFTDEV